MVCSSTAPISIRLTQLTTASIRPSRLTTSLRQAATEASSVISIGSIVKGWLASPASGRRMVP